MIANFQVALGRGHAGASLAFDRSPRDGPRTRIWPALLAALLTVPFALALALNAIAVYTHAFSTDSVPRWLFGAGDVGLGRLAALGPVAALALLAALRLRIRGSRPEGRWSVRVTARLTRWEVAVGVLALLIVAVFFGHLAADGLACANGVTRAC